MAGEIQQSLTSAMVKKDEKHKRECIRFLKDFAVKTLASTYDEAQLRDENQVKQWALKLQANAEQADTKAKQKKNQKRAQRATQKSMEAAAGLGLQAISKEIGDIEEEDERRYQNRDGYVFSATDLPIRRRMQSEAEEEGEIE